MKTHPSIGDKIRRIQNLLISRGTGGYLSDENRDEFISLRKELMSLKWSKSEYFPTEILEFQSLDMFWDKKLRNLPTYRERRVYVYDLFKNLLNEIELTQKSPADDLFSLNLDAEHIDEYWSKALDRRTSDPEGAITMARTLLEATCKKLLDEMKATYLEKDDLPTLYKKTANELNLSPDKQTEQIFKQILSGCQSVINGLASVRNKHSDSHGIVKTSYKPAIRHAELAVNLSGAMATFLFETWEDNFAKGKRVKRP